LKTLLKLLLVVAVINGSYQAGMAELNYSRFQDAIRSILALSTKTTVEEVRERVLKRAAELDLPVSPERLEISRAGVTTSLKLSYHVDVAVFPGIKYPRDYSISEEIAAIR
jgi:hypothetical protein